MSDGWPLRPRALLVTGLASSQMVHTAEVPTWRPLFWWLASIRRARRWRSPGNASCLAAHWTEHVRACSLLSRHGLRGAVRKE